MSKIRLFLLTLCLLISQLAWSQNSSTQIIPTKEGGIESIDAFYPDFIADDISEQVNNLADWVDSFFGETRADDERKQSTVRLTPTYKIYDGFPNESAIGVNLNLKLNNFENKARKIEDNIKEQIIPLDQADEKKIPESAKESLKKKKTKKKKSKIDKKSTEEKIAEIKSYPKKPVKKKITPTKKEDWNLNLETNLTVKSYLYLSTKVRTRKYFETHPLAHNLAIEGGWDTDLFWVSRLTLSSDAIILPTLLFRFTNEASWFLSGKDLQTVHGPSLIQTINEYNSVSYNFRKSYVMVNNSSVLNSTTYSINFRNSTPSKKIFLDIIPEFSYPRLYNYAETRSITFKLEYVF